MKQKNCVCETLPINYKNYTSKFIGSDKRYAEIEIKKCIHCNQNWLKYFVEYEYLRKSGRWYIGKIEERNISEINAENSVNKLEEMEWYFYGGSFFGTTGKIGNGKLKLD